MKPLRPILRDNPNERVRTLLRSAQLDSPPNDWKQRTLLAIGPAACLAPKSDITELGVGNGVGASGAVAPKVATTFAAKWAAIGAIAGGTLSATVMHAVDKHYESRTVVSTHANRHDTAVPHSETERQQRTSLEPSAQRAAVRATTSEGEAGSAIIEPPFDAVAPLRARSSATPAALSEPLAPTRAVMKQVQEPRSAVVTNETPARVTPPTSLGEEVRSLHRIRQMSLEQGAVAALEELDRHERHYSAPGLGIETAVLRIDLLWSAGQRSAAQTLAERFLLRHPDCPHAQHVRALLSRKAASHTRLQPAKPAGRAE